MAEEAFSGLPASGAGKGAFSPLSLPGGPDPVRPVSGAWWKAGRLSGHPRDNDAAGDFPARPGAPTKTFFGIPRGVGIPATLLSPASGRRSISPARVESGCMARTLAQVDGLSGLNVALVAVRVVRVA